MGFRYAVIGSGRQGTAAAYDLALLGDAESVLIADMSLAQAERSAARINALLGREVARAAQVNVQDEDAVVALLTGASIQVFVSRSLTFTIRSPGRISIFSSLLPGST